MKRVTLTYQNKDFSKPIEYTFNLIFSILGIEFQIFTYAEVPKPLNSDLLISYGPEKIQAAAEYHIHIYQSKLFSEEYKAVSSMPTLPLDRWNDLPVIYKGRGNLQALVVQKGQLIETNVDLIASSFFMVSRYEEIVIDEQDLYDRFPAEASVAYKENFLTRPIVNEYIELLWEWMRRFNLGFLRQELWGGKDFAILLTHDVDWLEKPWQQPFRSMASCLKHGQIGQASRYAWDWTTSSLLKIKPNPYWTFDYIIDLEHRYSLTSSFYFMTGGETEYDNHYSINSPEVISLIRRLEEKGHEVGFHGSFNSYNDPEMFVAEKFKLDQIVSNKRYGGRQHFLRWKTPDTWRIWEKSGMLYDATLGYAAHEGFRCGICLPHKPYDVIDNRIIDLWEIPLIVMEGTLHQYRSLSPDQGLASIESLIETVRKYHGVFVLLWHNSMLSQLYSPGWRGVFEKVVANASESSTNFDVSSLNRMGGVIQ